VLSEQEQRAIAKRTRREMQKRLNDRDMVAFGGKCDEKNFVDFTSWPTEFESIQSALDTYNKLGLSHKIMFRISGHYRDGSGLSSKFKLVCFHNREEKNNAVRNSSSTNVKSHKTSKGWQCPVSVTFKFKADKPPHGKTGKYVRSHHIICQHNHTLTIDERKIL
jgi:hypothetical protein